jgi:hypothetical protein
MMPTISTSTVPAKHETGEENGADDEHHAGHNRHPGRGLVGPIWPPVVRRRGWHGCGYGFLLKCFSHNAIVDHPV